MSPGPRKIVFVGGAPRSGTTVTHALICTSHSVSEYRPEISFFRGIPLAYRNGDGAFEHHTRHFFESPEAFRLHMRQTADLSLLHIWRHLGEPEVLALKDPLLTPFFPELARLYPDLAGFVTVVRHPFEVVRSRQEVHDKSSAGQPFTPEHAAQIAMEYMEIYQIVLATNFGGRHLAFRYEDLGAPHIEDALSRLLGVNDLHARPMWGQPPEIGDNPWGSPKYHQPLSLEPRLSPLATELQSVVRSICAPMMQKFSYG